jgi:large subunit ribosomal protein L29
MRVSQLRTKDMSELKQELKELLRAQFSMRMQLATQQTNKTHELQRIRRDIARVHTVLHDMKRKADA